MRIGSPFSGKRAALQGIGANLGLGDCQPFGGEVSLFRRYPSMTVASLARVCALPEWLYFRFIGQGGTSYILWVRGLKAILGALNADNRGEVFLKWKH